MTNCWTRFRAPTHRTKNRRPGRRSSTRCPESAARLTERSHLATQLLVGFLTAGALVLAARCHHGRGAGPLLPAQPDRGWTGHVRSAVSGPGSTPNDGVPGHFWRAVVAIPTGVTIRLCLWYPHSAWLVLSIYAAVAAGRVDPGGCHRRRTPDVPGDQADPRTARRCGDRCGDPAAAVDRQCLRRPSEPAVLSGGER